MILNMGNTENTLLSALVVNEKQDEKLSELPYNFYAGCVIEYEGETHILGGYNNLRKHYKRNNNTKAWEQLADLPYDVSVTSIVEYRGEIHIMGGGNTEDYQKHYKWNKVTDTWSSVSTTPIGVQGTSLVVKDDKIHLLGTVISISNYKKHYTWDGIKWSPDIDLPYDFYNANAIVKDDEIHILGSGASGNNRDKHYKLNKLTNEWEYVSTLPNEFYHGCALLKDNSIHIMGGTTNYRDKHHMLKDDNTWETLKDLPYEIMQGGAIIHDEFIHLLGTSVTTDQKTHYVLSSGTYIEGNVKKGTLIYCPYETFYNTPNTKRQNDSFKVLESGLVSIGVSDDISVSNKYEIKSYTGTGEKGSTYPCSISFSFAPKLVIWLGKKIGNEYDSASTSTCCNNVLTETLTTSFVVYQGFCGDMQNNYAYGKKSADGKTISWYNTQDVANQLNTSGTIYYFMGIA